MKTAAFLPFVICVRDAQWRYVSVVIISRYRILITAVCDPAAGMVRIAEGASQCCMFLHARWAVRMHSVN